MLFIYACVVSNSGLQRANKNKCEIPLKSLRHYRNLRSYDDGVISGLLQLIILLIFHSSHHVGESALKPHPLLQVFLQKNAQ